MTPPLLRVVVAAEPAAQIPPWIRTLSQQLPPGVLCVPWPVDDLCDTDLVLFLACETVSSEASGPDPAWVLRSTLAAQTHGYQVIQSPDALQQALYAIGRTLLPMAPALARPLLRTEMPARWQGRCEGCSDPACEHRLFTDLTRHRA